jgi:hypothetical protein
MCCVLSGRAKRDETTHSFEEASGNKNLATERHIPQRHETLNTLLQELKKPDASFLTFRIFDLFSMETQQKSTTT